MSAIAFSYPGVKKIEQLAEVSILELISLLCQNGIVLTFLKEGDLPQSVRGWHLVRHFLSDPL